MISREQVQPLSPRELFFICHDCHGLNHTHTLMLQPLSIRSHLLSSAFLFAASVFSLPTWEQPKWIFVQPALLPGGNFCPSPDTTLPTPHLGLTPHLCSPPSPIPNSCLIFLPSILVPSFINPKLMCLIFFS